MSTIKNIAVEGTDRTDVLKVKSLDWKWSLMSPASGSLTLLQLATADWNPKDGQLIEIFDKNETKVAAGMIYVTGTKEPEDGYYTHECDIVSLEKLAHHRVITHEWAGLSCGEIVQDIISRILTEENITEGDIMFGPELEEFETNVEHCDRTLSRLASEAGFFWRINADKSLDFLAPGQDPAPFNIKDANDDKWRDDSLTVDVDLTNLFNQVVVMSDGVVKERQEAFFIEQDNTWTVNLEFRIEELVEVRLNGQDETDIQDAGFSGLPNTGPVNVRKWTFEQGSRELSISTPYEPMDQGDVLEVIYVGRGQGRVLAEDSTSISNRASVEPGSGKHVKVMQQKYRTMDRAREVAKRLVDIFKDPDVIADYRTEETGLRVGQSQAIDLSDYQEGIDETDTFIKEIRLQDEGGVNGELVRQTNVGTQDPMALANRLMPEPDPESPPTEDMTEGDGDALGSDPVSDEGGDLEAEKGGSGQVWMWDGTTAKLVGADLAVQESFKPSNFSDASGGPWEGLVSKSSGNLLFINQGSDRIDEFNVNDPANPSHIADHYVSGGIPSFENAARIGGRAWLYDKSNNELDAISVIGFSRGTNQPINEASIEGGIGASRSDGEIVGKQAIGTGSDDFFGWSPQTGNKTNQNKFTQAGGKVHGDGGGADDYWHVIDRSGVLWSGNDDGDSSQIKRIIVSGGDLKIDEQGNLDDGTLPKTDACPHLA